MSANANLTRSDEKLPRNLKGRVVAMPAVDILENDDEFLVIADLPGVDAQHLDIKLEKGELFLEGSWSLPEDKGTPVAREYRPTDFRRSFLVPDSVEADKVAAEMTDGVLRVHLPKADAVKPRTIQVKAG